MDAVDGTDGGNDYYRGVCRYEKVLQFPFLDEGKQIWLEFEGVSQSCIVFVNGKQAGMHNGGYSAFRFNITDLILPGENRITIEVDNSKNDRVYPQKADFTFYGGLPGREAHHSVRYPLRSGLLGQQWSQDYPSGGGQKCPCHR